MAEKKEPNPQDVRIGQNLARFRGNMSQAELAKRMRDLNKGHRWSQTTVWTVEKGERPLKLSEASALAEVLKIELGQLMEDEAHQAKYELRLVNLQANEALLGVAKTFYRAIRKHRLASEILDELIEDGVLSQSEIQEFKEEIVQQKHYLRLFGQGISEENLRFLAEDES